MYMLKRFGYCVGVPNANLPWKYVAVTFRHALLKEKRLLYHHSTLLANCGQYIWPRLNFFQASNCARNMLKNSNT